MSNRIYNPMLALDKQDVLLNGSFVVGGSGAVGTAKGLGIKSVTKVGATTGQYDILLEDGYSRYMGGTWGVILATLSNVASIQVLANPSTFQAGFTTSPSIRIACADFAGAAVDPTSGSVIGFTVLVRRSSVGVS